jgi:hypothetical protein
VAHLAVDLTDAAACREAFGQTEPFTHVLYAALQEEDDLEAGWRSRAQQETNLAMLRNVVDGVEAGGRIRHFTILQGGKAYGSHLGRIPVPAKERWPRMSHGSSTGNRKTAARALAAGGWAINILRPQLILGCALSSPMNIIAAIGVYATILREAGEPLSFPGGGIYDRVHRQPSHRPGRRILRHDPSVAGEIFNIVNGTRSSGDMWPALAAYFRHAAR